MKTDIEIAQEAVMEPIVNVAEKLGVSENDLELYGKYKAKIGNDYLNSIQNRPDGKLILVTAINPTPAGEGKTTVTVGLGEAFAKLGKKRLLRLESLRLDPALESKEARQAAAMHRLFPWKTSICILPEISMRLRLQTICLQLCLTITSSRETNCRLIQGRLYGSAVWI